MQIVIDLDDNLYTRLFDNGVDYASDMRRACVAIREGIPLARGRGMPVVDALYQKGYLDAQKHILDMLKEKKNEDSD